MKQASQSIYLALALGCVNAQDTIIATGPADSGAVTSYYSICPTATSTTITLSTTTTLCPGSSCAGTTTIFYDAQPSTTVGPDGRTTIFEEHQYTAPCPCDGGICDAVYTVTRECPCTAPFAPTAAPAGFTTTAVACHVCAKNGGPSTVTVTTPASDGPYASQTPVMGTPYSGAVASAAASAYASAGPNGAVATGGSNAAASASNGDASAHSDSNGNAYAANDDASASSASDADAEAGSNDDSKAPLMPNPVHATGNNSTGITPPIASFTGSANRIVYTLSASFAVVIGWIALML